MISSAVREDQVQGGVKAALLRALSVCVVSIACVTSVCASSSLSDEEKLTLPQAREYMLSLINRDRATQRLGPLQLEEIATRAAQFHADTMADENFNSHWHPDGRKPPQRYTECGGMDYVMENSHGCGVFDPWFVQVPKRQLFTKALIEREEKAYFEELPPNDGHRRNILDPAHTHVGIGLKLVDLYHEKEFSENWVASAQEFINSSGSYNVNGKDFQRGKPYIVEGILDDGVSVYNVQVMREDLPKPVPLKKLQTQSVREYHGGYDLPTEEVGSVFPPPYVSPPWGQMRDQGKRFICSVTPQSNWKPGLYYLMVWGKQGKAANPVPIAMRTVELK